MIPTIVDIPQLIPPCAEQGQLAFDLAGDTEVAPK
jgi:hypothetical protein